MSQNILQVKQLTVKYNSTIVVDSIDFELKNETIVFYGPSGCGKTSILKALLNVHEPNMKTRGSILLDGNDIKKGSGEIGMTIQGPVVPSWLTIYNLCKMGSKMRRLNTQEQHDRIMSMLSSFKIDHLVDKYTHNISGGEKQRAALAITLLNEPKVLLLDEPTTFIDGITRMSIWSYIESKIYPMQIPTIVVSHDPMEALTLGDRILFLSQSAKIVKETKIPFPHPRTDELYENPSFWEMKKQLFRNEK